MFINGGILFEDAGHKAEDAYAKSLKIKYGIQEVEDAYAKALEIFYGIQEVTTSRQRKNGTRSFLMPTGQRIACYKSGYVRKLSPKNIWYQINKKYLQETRWTTMKKNGDLSTRRSTCWERELIPDPLARMKYMLEFYLKNYKK